MLKNYSLLKLLIPAALAFSSCGGSAVTSAQTAANSTTASETTGSLTLSLTPSSPSVLEGTSFTFSASGGVSPYSFYLVSGSGSIDLNSGFYSAPSEAGTAQVEVTDSAGNSAYGNITITAPIATLSISPDVVTLNVGAEELFTASGGTAPYTYSVISGGGSIGSSTGLYTADDLAGTATVEVTDVNGDTADAVITVSSFKFPGPTPRPTLTPVPVHSLSF